MTHRVTGLRLWCRRRRFLTAVRGQGFKEGRDSDAGMPSAIAEVVNERCDDLTLDQRPGIRNVIAKIKTSTRSPSSALVPTTNPQSNGYASPTGRGRLILNRSPAESYSNLTRDPLGASTMLFSNPASVKVHRLAKRILIEVPG